MRKNASEVLSTSPVSYIHDAELRGTLFDASDVSGMVSAVNTNFFVDHTEPLEWQWPLGKLSEGHEYLLILPATQRPSVSRSIDART